MHASRRSGLPFLTKSTHAADVAWRVDFARSPDSAVMSVNFQLPSLRYSLQPPTCGMKRSILPSPSMSAAAGAGHLGFLRQKVESELARAVADLQQELILSLLQLQLREVLVRSRAAAHVLGDQLLVVQPNRQGIIAAERGLHLGRRFRVDLAVEVYDALILKGRRDVRQEAMDLAV